MRLCPPPSSSPRPPAPLDSDGDGIPDAAERLAGTNPFDATSTFRIRTVQAAADGAHIEFPTVAGQTYRVEYCEDLAKGQWFILLDHIPGTGTPRTVIDPAASTLPKCFYRIITPSP